MSHVTSGRHNLAANTILVMRHLGMRAYQTPLFPALTAPEIKRLNYLDLPSLSREKLHVKREIRRVLDISSPLAQAAEDGS